MKNNKRIYGLVIIMSIVIVAYVVADLNRVKTIHLESGMMKTYENYEERMEGSDLVVTTQLIGKSENILTPFDGFPDGYHLSTIKIVNVIKGDPKLENTEIEIREPYYIMENGLEPGITEVYYGHYTKLQSDSTYVLFLGWVEAWNQYGISSAHQGKFKIDQMDKAEEDMHRKDKGMINLKEDIFSKLPIEKLN